MFSCCFITSKFIKCPIWEIQGTNRLKKPLQMHMYDCTYCWYVTSPMQRVMFLDVMNRLCRNLQMKSLHQNLHWNEIYVIRRHHWLCKSTSILCTSVVLLISCVHLINCTSWHQNLHWNENRVIKTPLRNCAKPSILYTSVWYVWLPTIWAFSFVMQYLFSQSFVFRLHFSPYLT
jgi:hypothetical protein